MLFRCRLGLGHQITGLGGQFQLLSRLDGRLGTGLVQGCERIDIDTKALADRIKGIARLDHIDLGRWNLERAADLERVGLFEAVHLDQGAGRHVQPLGNRIDGIALGDLIAVIPLLYLAELGFGLGFCAGFGLGLR